jgi:hypothetical protein
MPRALREVLDGDVLDLRAVLDEADAYSSITVNRLWASATIRSRQKSEPPSTAFAILR